MPFVDLVERGVHTLAVSLLHSYVNPGAQSEGFGRGATRRPPQVAVSLSARGFSDIPGVQRTRHDRRQCLRDDRGRPGYLRLLEEEMLGERGFDGELLVMQSSGGVAPAETMERYPSVSSSRGLRPAS